MAKPRAKEPLKQTTAKPGPAEAEAAQPASAKFKPAPVKSPQKPRAAESAGAKPAGAKRSPAAREPNVGEQPGDRLERLWAAIQQVRRGERDSPRTARLLAAGPPKLAQKVVEEAAEVAIEAVTGKREALINESVDLLYNLVALWNGLGVEPSAIWTEMDRREATLGMVEKLPKTDDI